MGACNSSGAAAQSVGQSCGRRLRNRMQQQRSSSSTTSSSTASSTDLITNNETSNKKGQQQEPTIRSIPVKLGHDIGPTDTNTNHPEKNKKKNQAPDSTSSSSSNSSSRSSSQPKKRESGQQQAPVNRDPESKAAKLAKLKEGVDFIENEDDVEAVESAVVKIQSTFRGKKIRSKLNQPKDNKESGTQKSQHQPKSASASESASLISKKEREENESQANVEAEEALSKSVAAMEVNPRDKTKDKATAEQQAAGPATNQNSAASDGQDRAAAKIQAGFKGYKTRKELAEEGKMVVGNNETQTTAK